MSQIITFYGYGQCSTCRKAEAWFKAHGYTLKKYDITITPPPAELIQLALSGDYQLQHIFNKSGEQYRLLKMKDKIKTMTEAEAIAKLTSNGRLVKRPIATDGKRITVGFDEEDYEKIWGCSRSQIM